MTFQTSEWTHPKTGEVRHYLKELMQIVNFRFGTHRSSGRISWASIDGETVSNRRGTDIYDELKGAKVFWTEDRGWTFAGMSVDLRERLEEKLGDWTPGGQNLRLQALETRAESLAQALATFRADVEAAELTDPEKEKLLSRVNR